MKASHIFLLILLSAICVVTISKHAQACYCKPRIKILSPENKTYAVNSIPLIFTISIETSWIGYSLDAQANITIPGNTTLSNLLDGIHNIVAYANNTWGKMGVSNRVLFAVDTTPPKIMDVSQIPSADNVYSEDMVTVNASVTDNLSGVKKVTLIYAYSNSSGTWVRIIAMTNLEGDIWNATIPPLPHGTNATYAIEAEDNVGNAATTEEMGYEYHYQVIPEFPSLIILPLFMTLSLLATIAYRRKHTLKA